MSEFSSTATDSIAAAFRRFKDTVSPEDARAFRSTSLGDVWKALRETEQKLAMKDESRALRRIEPFLTGLGHYSKAVEVLCNGTPYLPWIWAPVKLFLQIASDYLAAFDKLILAYKEIADCLPRFDRLSTALQGRPDFQNVLAVFYCDILDFHSRAYEFLRASGWKRFFDSSWGRFDHRFKAVLESLRHHAELIDKEANAYNIADAQDWREDSLAKARQSETDRFNDQFDKVINWLDVRDYTQEDDLDRLAEKCCTGTGDWLLQHKKVREWQTGRKACLWIRGIPGSGKSVLFAALVKYLQAQPENQIVAYHICSFRSGHADAASLLLRSLICQFVKQNRALVGYIYDEMLVKGLSPSKSSLKKLLLNLLPSTPSAKIAIDGLDECAPDAQKEIIAVITSLHAVGQSVTSCNVALFSRELPEIHRTFRKYPNISLKDEKSAVDAAIGLFVREEMQSIRENIDDTYASPDFLAGLEDQLIKKAEGMFLWVRLMFATLRDLHSVSELAQAIENLPSGLEEAYGRIFDRIKSDMPRGSHEKTKRLFALLAFTARPLTVHELLDGVVLSSTPYEVNERTKLTERELDLCKPLIELDAVSGVVEFVHFSVKEYILDASSGPFIDAYQGLTTIATACAASVIASLEFADPRTDASQQAFHVAMNFHAFHRYSCANWLAHLEGLVKFSGGGPLALDPELLPLVVLICNRHEQLLEAQPRNASVTLEINDLTARTNIFSALAPLRILASNIWTLESALADRIIEFDNSSAADQTLFSHVREQYQSLVERLLRADSERLYPHVPAHVITRFQGIYAGNQFLCRIPSCPRSSFGFSSEEARVQHEGGHRPRIMCVELDCAYHSTLGFRTSAQLRKHVQQYHSSGKGDLSQHQLARKRPKTSDFATTASTVRLPGKLATTLELYRFKFEVTSATSDRAEVDTDHLKRPAQLRWPSNFSQQDKDRYGRCLQKLWLELDTDSAVDAFDNKQHIGRAALHLEAIIQQHGTCISFNDINSDDDLEGGDILDNFDFDTLLNGDGTSSPRVTPVNGLDESQLRDVQPMDQQPNYEQRVQQHQQAQLKQRAMDIRPFPKQVLTALAMSVPDVVNSWGKLKQHISQNQGVLPQGLMERLSGMQNSWFHTHPEELKLAVQQFKDMLFAQSNAQGEGQSSQTPQHVIPQSMALTPEANVPQIQTETQSQMQSNPQLAMQQQQAMMIRRQQQMAQMHAEAPSRADEGDTLCMFPQQLQRLQQMQQMQQQQQVAQMQAERMMQQSGTEYMNTQQMQKMQQQLQQTQHLQQRNDYLRVPLQPRAESPFSSQAPPPGPGRFNAPADPDLRGKSRFELAVREEQEQQRLLEDRRRQALQRDREIAQRQHEAAMRQREDTMPTRNSHSPPPQLGQRG